MTRNTRMPSQRLWAGTWMPSPVTRTQQIVDGWYPVHESAENRTWNLPASELYGSEANEKFRSVDVCLDHDCMNDIST